MGSATIFWTAKRLEAFSKTSLTLFQAFLIAGTVGGVLGKLQAVWMKAVFVVATVVFFSMGVLFADWPIRKKEER